MAAGKRTFALLCCALFFLGGCSGLSSGEYYREKDHIAQPAENDETSSNSIGNYYTLQTALQNMIRSARESDSIRVSGYTGDLDEDLETIRQYFTTVYPLGVYAVQGIGYDKTRILSEMEISVTIQYRRTAEEIRSVVEVLDDSDFERRMTEYFRSFREKRVFSFTWFTDSDERFMARMMKSWAAAAEYAVGLRELSFTFYPEDEYRRIVEIDAKYIDDADQLRAQAQATRERCDEIVDEQLQRGETDRETLQLLAEWLLANVQLDEEATRVSSETEGMQRKTSVYTAYGALIEQTAAQSGLVLAAGMLGGRLGLDCTVVIGSRDGQMYWWLAVQTDEGWLHLDLLSQEGQSIGENGESAFLPQYIFDEDEAAARFDWDKTLYRLS